MLHNKPVTMSSARG